MLETIGEGAHAIVKRATLNSDPSTNYAVKIFRTGEPELLSNIRKTYLNTKLLEKNENIIHAYELYLNE